jgi:Tol biopolymer transport system component
VSIDAFTPADLGLGGALPGEATVVSTNAAGDVANGTSFAPSLSADGRFVSFASVADNLVAADANDAFDVFRKDLSTGAVELVSQIQVPGQGVVQANGDSFFSALSADGDVVAFDSAAGNLSGVETGQSNVFVNTAGAADPSLVSIVGNRFASDPSISADGTLVAFGATATGRAETGDPAPLDTIMSRVYVRDLGDGSLLEASSDSAGNYADGPSSDPDLSGNGNFVAFDSAAGNLVAADANRGYDVYVKSVLDGSIRLASTDSAGQQGFGDSVNASISGNGRFVAFQSQARFVAADSDSRADIYLKDMQSGELTLVTVNADGVKANGASFTPSISADGRFVAFRSGADNLVAGDDNGQPDIFVFDTLNGEFARIELTSDTTGANPGLVGPEISADGAFVAFVDEVTVAGNGSLTAGQVLVAPSGGTSPATLALTDVLSSDGAPAGGAMAATAGDAGAAVSAAGAAPQLDTLVTQPDAA